MSKRMNWRDQDAGWHGIYSRCIVVYCKGLRIYPKISVLPLELCPRLWTQPIFLLFSPRHVDRRKCCQQICGMRQKRRNMPHDAAPQRTASGVNEPLYSMFLFSWKKWMKKTGWPGFTRGMAVETKVVDSRQSLPATICASWCSGDTITRVGRGVDICRRSDMRQLDWRNHVTTFDAVRVLATAADWQRTLAATTPTGR